MCENLRAGVQRRGSGMPNEVLKLMPVHKSTAALVSLMRLWAKKEGGDHGRREERQLTMTAASVHPDCQPAFLPCVWVAVVKNVPCHGATSVNEGCQASFW